MKSWKYWDDFAEKPDPKPGDFLDFDDGYQEVIMSVDNKNDLVRTITIHSHEKFIYEIQKSIDDWWGFYTV